VIKDPRRAMAERIKKQERNKHRRRPGLPGAPRHKS
jgi:hypothetical protein